MHKFHEINLLSISPQYNCHSLLFFPRTLNSLHFTWPAVCPYKDILSYPILSYPILYVLFWLTDELRHISVFTFSGTSVMLPYNNHHHISFMQLGHLLNHSDLTYPEDSSKVYCDSFFQSDSSVSLHWVIYFEAFYLHFYTASLVFQYFVQIGVIFLLLCNVCICSVICPIVSCCYRVFHLCCCYSSGVLAFRV